MTAVLDTWNLSRNDMANSFHAAAVKSGTLSWKAFFFGSIDPGNSITVDKPPASLWLMEISGRIFGFSSWSRWGRCDQRHRQRGRGARCSRVVVGRRRPPTVAAPPSTTNAPTDGPTDLASTGPSRQGVRLQATDDPGAPRLPAVLVVQLQGQGILRGS